LSAGVICPYVHAANGLPHKVGFLPMVLIDTFRRVIDDPKQRVALTSVIAAIFLVLFKLYIGIVTKSLGILSEALHSGLDLVAAAITMAAVLSSAKPPDRDHPFGHGKIENFSALVETVLLLVTCIWIVWEAVDRIFFHDVHVEASWASFVVMGTSIAIDVSRSRALANAAKKYNSQALEADALHFSSDILSSLVVIAGLVSVKLGFPLGDPLAAIGVAVFIIAVSFRLGKRTVDHLMDRAPEGKAEEISDRVSDIDGITCERVRVRTAGPDAFVEVKVSADRNIPLELSGDIVKEVKAKTREVIKGADVVVQVNPLEPPDENIYNKITLIALKVKRIKGIHKINVRQIDAERSVTLHLELDSRLTVKEAHDLVEVFENNAKTELGIKEINTHIETHASDVEVAIGEDLTDRYTDTISHIRRIVACYPQIDNCHRLTLRRANGKLSVSMHCVLHDEEPLVKAHDLCTVLEAVIRDEIAAIDDITIHIDPLSQGLAPD
jgi:cation diffusion facilitator family transporter